MILKLLFFQLFLLFCSCYTYKINCVSDINKAMEKLYTSSVPREERFNFLVRYIKLDRSTAYVMESVIEKLNEALRNETQIVKELATKTNLLIFVQNSCWETTLQSDIKRLTKYGNASLAEAERLKDLNQLVENNIVAMTASK